jgi:anti-anti-sigma factor
MSNARQVFDRVAALVQSQASVIILDLSATGYLDSSGIAMVFRLAERLRVGRQELRLVVPTTARIRPVVDLTAVDRVVHVYSTVAEASPATRT